MTRKQKCDVMLVNKWDWDRGVLFLFAGVVLFAVAVVGEALWSWTTHPTDTTPIVIFTAIIGVCLCLTGVLFAWSPRLICMGGKE